MTLQEKRAFELLAEALTLLNNSLADKDLSFEDSKRLDEANTKIKEATNLILPGFSTFSLN